MKVILVIIMLIAYQGLSSTKLIQLKKYQIKQVPQSFNFIIFILISIISRGLRFFIISYLSFKFGHLFTEFMEKHGSKWFTIIGILIVIISIIIYLISKFYG